MTRFDGKAALITGAAGGIGAETARCFARQGARLLLLDRNPESLATLADECRAGGAPSVLALDVDQTNRSALTEAVEASWRSCGRIDALFANAGYGQFSPFLSLTKEAWSRHVDVNLNGTFHVCQEVAQRMAADRGGGTIVINASSGAVVYADQLSAYCITKAALRMLALAMASELGVHRIRVNAVMPGVIETSMTAPMLADEHQRQALLAETPVGRLGRPQDVADLVCFLSSDQASYITGEAIMVDGGQTIHGYPRWFKLDYRREFDEQWEIGR